MALDAKIPLGVLAATLILEPTLPVLASPDNFTTAALWAIKVVGTVAGLLVVWYVKRITGKLESALDFYQKAPADFWDKFATLGDTVHDLGKDMKSVRKKLRMEE